MPQDYHHGVRVIEVNQDVRSIRAVSTAIISFVATAKDADTYYFPVDTPVLISDVDEAIGKAGTSSTLKNTLDAIANQTWSVIIAARAAEGADDAATRTNIIGVVDATGQRTGMQALPDVQQPFCSKPHILCAPS